MSSQNQSHFLRRIWQEREEQGGFSPFTEGQSDIFIVQESGPNPHQSRLSGSDYISWVRSKEVIENSLGILSLFLPGYGKRSPTASLCLFILPPTPTIISIRSLPLRKESISAGFYDCYLLPLAHFSVCHRRGHSGARRPPLPRSQNAGAPTPCEIELWIFSLRWKMQDFPSFPFFSMRSGFPATGETV